MTLSQIKKYLNSDNSYQIIVTDKNTAKRISYAFITRGWWFIYYHIENYHYIVTPNSMDLNWYRRRGYKFELA